MLLVCGFPKETVTAIMIHYRNTKTLVCSSYGITDYVYFVIDVLKEGKVDTYLFILCVDYVLRTSLDLKKQNGLTLKRYDADDIPQKKPMM